MVTACKRLGTEVRIAPLRTFVVLSAAVSAYALSKADGLELRGQFPEPLDFVNHAANAGGSLGLSFWYGSVAALTYARVAERPTPAKARAVGIGIGAGLVLTANVLWETKTGTRIIHDTKTVEDLRDLAWGATGAAIGAAAIEVRSSEPPMPPIEAGPAAVQSGRDTQP